MTKELNPWLIITLFVIMIALIAYTNNNLINLEKSYREQDELLSNSVEILNAKLDNVFIYQTQLWIEESAERDWDIDCEERILGEDEMEIWKVSQDYVLANVLVDGKDYVVRYDKDKSIDCFYEDKSIDCEEFLCEPEEIIVEELDEDEYVMEVVNGTLDLTEVQDKIN